VTEATVRDDQKEGKISSNPRQREPESNGIERRECKRV